MFCANMQLHLNVIKKLMNARFSCRGSHFIYNTAIKKCSFFLENGLIISGQFKVAFFMIKAFTFASFVVMYARLINYDCYLQLTVSLLKSSAAPVVQVYY